MNAQSEADADHDGADQRRVADHLARVGWPWSPSTITGSCRPMRMNRVALSRNVEHRPEREALQPGLGGDELRRAPAEIDAGSDRGEHAGDAELVGRDEGRRSR